MNLQLSEVAMFKKISRWKFLLKASSGKLF